MPQILAVAASLAISQSLMIAAATAAVVAAVEFVVDLRTNN